MPPRRVGGFVREVVDGAAQHAEELVESVAVGTELRLPAEMPLADERRVVAVRFQQRGDRRMLRRQSEVGGELAFNGSSRPTGSRCG